MLGLGAVALGMTGAGVTPALASQDATADPPVTIRDGKHFVVVHNIDLVGAFGYAAGAPLKLEVLRGESRIPIARVEAPAYDVEGEFGLEVNHGPEGPVRPGDCFEGVTPDIRPFDTVQVTDASGGVDRAFIDNITIDDVAAEGANVLVTGFAQFADGSPIPVEMLDSGFWRGANEAGVDTRGDAPDITLVEGGRYEARYNAPDFGTFRGGSASQDTVLNASHEFGYGHAVPPAGQPLPAEIQLVEGAGESNGPVLGCPGRASAPNDITVVDDETVNLTSGALEVSGPAATGTTAVDVTLDDGPEGGAPVTGAVDLDEAGAWKATFDREQLATLNDGTLTILASFTGSVPAEAVREIGKDTVAPATPTADPAPGSYVGDQFVGLAAEEGATIRWTADESDPASGAEYTEPIRVSESRTIRAIAVDAAGNASGNAELAYEIMSPPPAAEPSVLTPQAPALQPQPSGDSVTVVDERPPTPVNARTLRMTSVRIRRASSQARVRRAGILVAYTPPAGADAVKLVAYRAGTGRTGSARRAVVTRTVRVTGTAAHTLRLRSKRFRTGRYILEMRAVRDGVAGRLAKRTFQIKR